MASASWSLQLSSLKRCSSAVIQLFSFNFSVTGNCSWILPTVSSVISFLSPFLISRYFAKKQLFWKTNRHFYLLQIWFHLHPIKLHLQTCVYIIFLPAALLHCPKQISACFISSWMLLSTFLKIHFLLTFQNSTSFNKEQLQPLSLFHFTNYNRQSDTSDVDPRYPCDALSSSHNLITGYCL